MAPLLIVGVLVLLNMFWIKPRRTHVVFSMIATVITYLMVKTVSYLAVGWVPDFGLTQLAAYYPVWQRVLLLFIFSLVLGQFYKDVKYFDYFHIYLLYFGFIITFLSAATMLIL